MTKRELLVYKIEYIVNLNNYITYNSWKYNWKYSNPRKLVAARDKGLHNNNQAKTVVYVITTKFGILNWFL